MYRSNIPASIETVLARMDFTKTDLGKNVRHSFQLNVQ